MLSVDGCHARGDETRDSFGGQRHAEAALHVSGPFERTHPHHLPSGLLSPPSACFSGDPAAGFVPNPFGVDEHPVEVEYDGLDFGRLT